MSSPSDPSASDPQPSGPRPSGPRPSGPFASDRPSPYGGSPSGAPPYAAGAAAPIPEPGASNPAGKAAFVLAVVLVVLGLGQQLIGLTLPYLSYRFHLGTSSLTTTLTLTGVFLLLVAIATTVLAIVGVLQRAKPRLLAAIALGVGGSAVIGGVFGLVASPILGLILR